MANEKRLDLIARSSLGIGKAKREAFNNPAYADGWNSAIAIIENAPTVDAVEVVHAEWEKYTDDKFIGYGADGRIRYRKVYSYKCSKCWNYTAVKHKYCPNCGAKMDGGNEDEV